MYRNVQITVHYQSEAGACLKPEPGDPDQACVPGAVVSGQPGHPGIFKDLALAVTQGPGLKLLTFIIHNHVIMR